MGTTIDVAAIERELTSLWKQAGEDEEEGGVIRSCLLNLMIYTPGTLDLRETDDLIAEITAAHPSRALLMIADREAEESSITAEVTSRCTIPTGMAKQVCCEQVTITARRAQVDDVASVVMPLLLADLPVYLWWRAVPRLDDRAFQRLVDVADRVIIDSADFADQQGDLATLADVLVKSPRWAAFSDLNWSRLTAWRALLAGFYDVAQYRPLFDQMNRVVIEHAPPSDDRSVISARALLLAAWLQSRLGWQLNPESLKRTDEAVAFELNAGGRAVSLEFVPTARQIEPGHLALVTIGSALNPAASFSVRRSGDATRIETAVTLGEESHIQRVLSYENWSESALIGRELEIMGHDRVYEQAVIAAGEIVGALTR
jgi:glucose-6-phosphate dehydrogenase assembly protein OpcA